VRAAGWAAARAGCRRAERQWPRAVGWRPRVMAAPWGPVGSRRGRAGRGLQQRRLQATPRAAAALLSACLLLAAITAGGAFVGGGAVFRAGAGAGGGSRRAPERAAQSAATGGTVAEAPQAPMELFAQLFQQDQRPVVLYDGVCNMCNKAVDVALEKDPRGRKLRFAALQSEVGRGLLVFCGRDAVDLSSMIVVRPDGTCLAQSDAALFVGKQLDGSPLLSGASRALSGLLPKAVRDVAYDTLAANRYKVLGRRGELRLGEDDRSDRFLSGSGQPSPAAGI